MTIQVGVPFDVTLWKAAVIKEDESLFTYNYKQQFTGTCPIPQKTTSKDLFENKKVVLFALPGTCSGNHLPGYVEHAGEIKSKGIDSIICLSTNDSFVMSYWAKDRNVGDAVQLIADGNSEFTQKVGLIMDGSAFGMGALRSKRYAAIIDNGVVKYIGVEEPGKFELSAADNILKQL
ncbi:peroxiredoxin [Heterostelium album PN500]|uniref:Peroxiredoxin n=1 Tax=Heterostelium pallidum (strain ATCC 26659 / Pp 5 / PN500) TaxID=670386 RepID=D3BUP0_HETP5|nr:peroxiredoxin [Heterostelium album PN500]EFA74828.1 peroxiredoxin [Heterostelium album PN500]|eukprot:XP_020426962.1 peroxiredoxin [Heterostelium album PN500]